MRPLDQGIVRFGYGDRSSGPPQNKNDLFIKNLLTFSYIYDIIVSESEGNKMKTLEDILFYNFSYEERLSLLTFLEMAKKEYGNITIEQLFHFVNIFVKRY